MQQNRIWMLYLIIGVWINIVFLSCSPTIIEAPTQRASFIYKNNFSSAIKLDLFLKYNKQLLTSATLQKGDTILFLITGGPGAHPFRDNTSSELRGDSCVIKFSNNRCTSYNFDKEQFGVFWLKDYDDYSPKVGNPTFSLHYTIDSTDYKRAVPCQ